MIRADNVDVIPPPTASVHNSLRLQVRENFELGTPVDVSNIDRRNRNRTVSYRNPILSSSTDAVHDQHSEPPATKAEGEILGTWFNVCLLFAFQVLQSCGNALMLNVGYYYYVPVYRMPLTWSWAANVLSTFVGVYATVFIAAYGDHAYGHPALEGEESGTAMKWSKTRLQWVMTRFGKRKPWLALFWPFISIALIGVFFERKGSSGTAVQAWYLICLVVYYAAYACFQSVFEAWFIESCSNSQDYLKIASLVVNIANSLGYVLGLACTKTFCHDEAALRLVALSVALGGLVVLSAIFCFIDNRIINKMEDRQYLLGSFRILSRRKEYRVLLGNRLLVSTAFILNCEFFIYAVFICFPGVSHFETVLEKHYLYSSVSACVAVVVILAVHRWVFKNMDQSPSSHDSFDKINVYLGLTLVFVVISFLMLVVMLPNMASSDVSLPTSRGLFQVWMALMILASSVYTGITFLEQLLMRDLIRSDTYHTGLNRENMYQAALNIPSQIGSYLLASIPMSIFSSTGFTQTIRPGADDIHRIYSWTASSHQQIVFFSTLLFGAVAGLAWYAFFRFRNQYDLKQGNVAKVEKALQDRANKMAEYEKQPVVLTDEKMLMNNFSPSEIYAMTQSPCKTLQTIQLLHRANLFVGCPAAIACIAAALIVHTSANSRFQILLTSLFCATTFFAFYEGLRSHAIKKLMLETPTIIKDYANGAREGQKEDYRDLAEPLPSADKDANHQHDDDCRQSSMADSIPDVKFEKVLLFEPFVWDYVLIICAEVVLVVIGIVFTLYVPARQRF